MGLITWNMCHTTKIVKANNQPFLSCTLLASADDGGESSAVKTKESINTTSFTEHMTDAADDDEHC